MPTPDFADALPAYVQIANDLRSRIGTGEYPAGGRLPSNKAMSESYGVAAETIRQALEVLRREGLIGTQSTRGTFVLRERSETERQDAEALQQQVSGLRDEVHDLTAQVETLKSADVRAALERLELNLIDLYGKLGYDYPREGSAEDGESSATVAAHGKRA